MMIAAILTLFTQAVFVQVMFVQVVFVQSFSFAPMTLLRIGLPIMGIGFLILANAEQRFWLDLIRLYFCWAGELFSQ